LFTSLLASFCPPAFSMSYLISRLRPLYFRLLFIPPAKETKCSVLFLLNCSLLFQGPNLLDESLPLLCILANHYTSLSPHLAAWCSLSSTLGPFCQPSIGYYKVNGRFYGECFILYLYSFAGGEASSFSLLHLLSSLYLRPRIIPTFFFSTAAGFLPMNSCTRFVFGGFLCFSLLFPKVACVPLGDLFVIPNLVLFWSNRYSSHFPSHCPQRIVILACTLLFFFLFTGVGISLCSFFYWFLWARIYPQPHQKHRMFPPFHFRYSVWLGRHVYSPLSFRTT